MQVNIMFNHEYYYHEYYSFALTVHPFPRLFVFFTYTSLVQIYHCSNNV